MNNKITLFTMEANYFIIYKIKCNVKLKHSVHSNHYETTLNNAITYTYIKPLLLHTIHI